MTSSPVPPTATVDRRHLVDVFDTLADVAHAIEQAGADELRLPDEAQLVIALPGIIASLSFEMGGLGLPRQPALRAHAPKMGCIRGDARSTATSGCAKLKSTMTTTRGHPRRHGPAMRRITSMGSRRP